MCAIFLFWEDFHFVCAIPCILNGDLLYYEDDDDVDDDGKDDKDDHNKDNHDKEYHINEDHSKENHNKDNDFFICFLLLSAPFERLVVSRMQKFLLLQST